MSGRTVALVFLFLMVGFIVVGFVAAWRDARRQRVEVERRRKRGLPVSPLREAFSGPLPKGMLSRLAFWIPILVSVPAVAWVRAVFHLDRSSPLGGTVGPDVLSLP